MKLQLDKSFISAMNLVESSPDMIIAVDNDRKIIEFNAAAELIFGYQRKEIIGEHINKLYANPELGVAIHKKTLIDGHHTNEIKNITKSGKTFYSYISTSVLYDYKGEKVGVMGISKDISGLRKSKSDITVSLKYAKSIIDCSMDMIIAVDSDRNIIEFNKAAENTFGYQAIEVIGKTVDNLYAEPEEGKNINKNATMAGRALGEVQSRKKNGEVFISLISASVLLDEDGNEVGIMGISRDITSLKRGEEILKSSEEKHRMLSIELAEANIMKELLLDVITHDMKNTLGTLNGMSELLTNEYGNNEHVDVIVQCTNNLMDIIDNASVLTKVTLGEEISKKNINLLQMISDIANDFITVLESYQITLQMELSSDLTVKANPIISEVFKNYVSNAIKYGHDGKRIIIHGSETEDSVLIKVIDFGTTIDEQEYEAIFKRKVQLAGTNKIGRGLGLAIVKRIANSHDAAVGVIPNSPSGNQFYIKFNKN
ncbi:MAG: PAS domain-containing sensor histidine kinase [Candidatus Marinimicrobia bacterium]|jgi:PAS domain S-box-containing protein|nr:PAS domain-containing sensor histidine kinase [Candidatus Neomarinimicrobiota bacterium]MBT3682677.1 PAS domain-containing sensor histidine kinase [Candidatus Neomarinimicrobiota bacterium]MBT3759668.1 PAS domain-containing sensor histidine kinase [Candidatus Neomarinimicrobiota bacterium]MBT3894460.1 PAS domain-containing sensor histidine kinase [Candidatus Neomarinimicrobiota bacterium]MBT4172503.1 PAS domain-containing sensor histidine kinase [Candidatus Neomarinimicrobiota bacterium]